MGIRGQLYQKEGVELPINQNSLSVSQELLPYKAINPLIKGFPTQVIIYQGLFRFHLRQTCLRHYFHNPGNIILKLTKMKLTCAST